MLMQLPLAVVTLVRALEVSIVLLSLILQINSDISSC